MVCAKWVLGMAIACAFSATWSSANAETSAHAAPASSLPLLGKIADSFRSATLISGKQFTDHPADFICLLPGGELYFETKSIDVDDDGSSVGAPPKWEAHPDNSKGIPNSSHSDATSLGGALGGGKNQPDRISPFLVPYIVLPGAHTPLWFAQWRIHIGDGAIVIKGSQMIVAVFADAGPDTKIAEMSIRSHQLFGFEAFAPGVKYKRDANGALVKDPQTGRLVVDHACVRTINVAQAAKPPDKFIVIVFPGSAARTTDGKRPILDMEKLKAAVSPKFTALTGVAPQLQPGN